MRDKLRMKKIYIPLISGIFLTLVCFSLSSADILFSTDIPANIGSGPFEEGGIIHYDVSDFSSVLTGSDLGIAEGVNVDAFGFSGSDIFFTVDIPTEIDGGDYTERDLILYDGSTYSKLLDGEAVGIPNGAHIDAATVLDDHSIVFSLDIPSSLGGTEYKENDLIRYNGSSFSLYLDGSDITEGADIDGVYVNSEGDILFSLDIPTEVDVLEVTGKDVVEYDDIIYALYFDGVSAGLPLNTNLDALNGCESGDGDCDNTLDVDDNCSANFNPFQEDTMPPDGNGCGDLCECEGDFEPDGDVDGTDAVAFKTDFFRKDCAEPTPCNGDFECDGDVDGTDAVKFKADFFRKDCPSCGGWPCVYE